MKAVRVWLLIFIVGLVISGTTAFPLVSETSPLARVLPAPSASAAWIDRIRPGLAETGKTYPFIAYGTDWPAFAHLVIAIVFRSLWRDPVPNVGVIE
jgi:hypothetical protein